MAMIRGPARALCTLGAALFILSGCDKLSSHDDTAWARAALARNDRLEIIAADSDAHTFTVKMKDTGELRVVRVDQIVGDVPAQTSASSQAAKAAAQPAATAASHEGSSSSAPAQTSAAAGERARPAAGVEARYPTTSATAAKTASGTAVITDPATGNVLASSDAAAAPTPTQAADNKKVLAEGPGYTIKAGDVVPPAPVRLASRSAEIPSPARGVALERRYEPIICQGQRLLHIDGRNLEFEGDAVTAEDGCEIHITNSHIIAHGVGVSARAANVHIKNSLIEGESGSISASQGAQVYTQSTTFKGLSRRLDSAAFHDLGDTVWN